MPANDSCYNRLTTLFCLRELCALCVEIAFGLIFAFAFAVAVAFSIYYLLATICSSFAPKGAPTTD
jgi:hypothetical protein